jgi:hypothetical protein
MPPPEDKKGAERLLDTVKYLTKFIPNMSMIMQPIREVMKSGMEFQWGGAQEKAFQEVKEILTKAPVLAYDDVKKPVTVTCDASKSSLGAALLQDDKPVMFASIALTGCGNSVCAYRKRTVGSCICVREVQPVHICQSCGS